jgi:hypothetical protein
MKSKIEFEPKICLPIDFTSENCLVWPLEKSTAIKWANCSDEFARFKDIKFVYVCFISCPFGSKIKISVSEN